MTVAATTKVCKICGGKYHAKDLCAKHYRAHRSVIYYQAHKAENAEKTRKWRAANTDRLRELNKAQHHVHKAKRNAASLAYRAANLERMRALGRAWSKNNLDKQNAYKGKRRARKTAAIFWGPDRELDMLVMSEIYSLAKLRSAATGIAGHVDHIVPLVSRKVCGLHCAANLQLIPARANVSKGNRVWPDMPT